MSTSPKKRYRTQTLDASTLYDAFRYNGRKGTLHYADRPLSQFGSRSEYLSNKRATLGKPVRFKIVKQKGHPRLAILMRVKGIRRTIDALSLAFLKNTKSLPPVRHLIVPRDGNICNLKSANLQIVDLRPLTREQEQDLRRLTEKAVFQLYVFDAKQRRAWLLKSRPSTLAKLEELKTSGKFNNSVLETPKYLYKDRILSWRSRWRRIDDGFVWGGTSESYDRTFDTWKVFRGLTSRYDWVSLPSKAVSQLPSGRIFHQVHEWYTPELKLSELTEDEYIQYEMGCEVPIIPVRRTQTVMRKAYKRVQYWLDGKPDKERPED
jgi:hypothetical protein